MTRSKLTKNEIRGAWLEEEDFSHIQSGNASSHRRELIAWEERWPLSLSVSVEATLFSYRSVGLWFWPWHWHQHQHQHHRLWLSPRIAEETVLLHGPGEVSPARGRDVGFPARFPAKAMWRLQQRHHLWSRLHEWERSVWWWGQGSAGCALHKHWPRGTACLPRTASWWRRHGTGWGVTSPRLRMVRVTSGRKVPTASSPLTLSSQRLSMPVSVRTSFLVILMPHASCSGMAGCGPCQASPPISPFLTWWASLVKSVLVPAQLVSGLLLQFVSFFISNSKNLIDFISSMCPPSSAPFVSYMLSFLAKVSGSWGVGWGICSQESWWWGFRAPYWAFLFRSDCLQFSILSSPSFPPNCLCGLCWISHLQFTTGVYAGDPSKLSMKAAFGKVWRLEQNGDSIIGGTFKAIQERNNSSNPPRDP